MIMAGVPIAAKAAPVAIPAAKAALPWLGKLAASIAVREGARFGLGKIFGIGKEEERLRKEARRRMEREAMMAALSPKSARYFS